MNKSRGMGIPVQCKNFHSNFSHAHAPQPNFTHFHSFSVTVIHFQSLSFTFSHCHSLSVTITHFQSLTFFHSLSWLSRISFISLAVTHSHKHKFLHLISFENLVIKFSQYWIYLCKPLQYVVRIIPPSWGWFHKYFT